MIILIDNYDSFTFNIYHYFGEIGANLEVFRNDGITIDEIKEMKPKAVILSPGPCTPNEAGICVDLVKNFKNNFPILGICLGHQSIGQAFGSQIIQCNQIMHGKIDNIIHNNHNIFKNVEKNFKATRYHSLIIDKKTLSKEFEIIAKTNNNTIMGIAHKTKKIIGLQFHPESIGTKSGKNILKNFLKIIKYNE